MSQWYRRGDQKNRASIFHLHISTGQTERASGRAISKQNGRKKPPSDSDPGWRETSVTHPNTSCFGVRDRRNRRRPWDINRGARVGSGDWAVEIDKGIILRLNQTGGPWRRSPRYSSAAELPMAVWLFYFLITRCFRFCFTWRIRYRSFIYPWALLFTYSRVHRSVFRDCRASPGRRALVRIETGYKSPKIFLKVSKNDRQSISP